VTDPLTGRKMISIKKYLFAEKPAIAAPTAPGLAKEPGDLFSLLLSAYRSALSRMGQCGVDACPTLGSGLERQLSEIAERLEENFSLEEIEALDAKVQAELQHWGRCTAQHYQQKAAEVKEILLMMACAVKSVGERDHLYAVHFHEVTGKLNGIANLDDLAQIRTSIEKTASELKSSIDRMAAEGNAALELLQQKVSACQQKLEDAEQMASLDTLTQVRSRMWVEGQMEQRIAAAAPFCVAILDLDGFMQVNDEYGHLVGDELLRQFGAELRSTGRATNIVGRWGGDEFVVVLDCGLPQAQERIDRLSAWVCGSYTVEAAGRPVKLRLDASIGLAQFAPPETLRQLLERADVAMYRQKAVARSGARDRRRSWGT
jgi:diguanylate cyclase (GGDEF)-like protein